MKMEPPAIENSFEKLDKYPSVVERYYSKYFHAPNPTQPEEGHSILLHSNRICLLTLAENHPIIANQKTITKIDFQISDKIDRRDSKVVGKGKKGGQFLAPNAILCHIECSDSTKYTVYSCVKGKLIELNENLLKNYELLVKDPDCKGFIAIILPHIKDIDFQKKTWQLCRESMAMKSDNELLEID